MGARAPAFGPARPVKILLALFATGLAKCNAGQFNKVLT